MVDLHSHILYGIDDGSKSLEESIKILKKAYDYDITDIVLTPHYIKNSKYNANNNKKMELLNILRNELKKRDIDINLYLGNEVYADENLISLLKSDISLINNSKYMLIEFPMSHSYPLVDEVIDEILDSGIIPVIAHPERYRSYYMDFDFFYRLRERGCLFQANIGSLFDYYGSKTKKMLKELLKRDLIDVFGSDIHHESQEFYELDIERKLKKLVKDDKKVKDLLINNGLKIINNK